MKRRTALLILLMVLTIIPTVYFLVGFVLITSFFLQNFGNVQVFSYGDVLHIRGKGATGGGVTVGSFSLFVGCTIACIAFFVALFLLIRGWFIERRKKHRARESYTV